MTNRPDSALFEGLMAQMLTAQGGGAAKAFFLALEEALGALKVERCFDACVAGEGTRFYPTAEVINLLGRREDIQIGRDTHVRGELLTARTGGKISVGDRCYIAETCRIWSMVNISFGDDVLISHGVTIVDNDGHEIDPSEREKSVWTGPVTQKPDSITQFGNIKASPITFGNNIIVYPYSIIRRGISIGSGSTIGAASVVNNDVPPNCLVVGNPARVVRTFTD